MSMKSKGKFTYFDRDLSWLSFNERILMEAGRPGVPVGEKLSFLGIFSSNLDEFYRVRMPAILALKHLDVREETFSGQQHLQQTSPAISAQKEPPEDIKEVKPPHNQAVPQPPTLPSSACATAELLGQVRSMIDGLQNRFGLMLLTDILPDLRMAGIDYKYNARLPENIDPRIQARFFEKVAAHLTMVWLADQPGREANTGNRPEKKLRARFFPENDQIYLLVPGILRGAAGLGIIRIPALDCGRFVSLENKQGLTTTDVWMLDDIIRMHIPTIFSADFIYEGSYSFKLSRDADVDYKDEYGKDLASFIQRQIGKRNYGLATRLLYDTQMPKDILGRLTEVLNCPQSALVRGGRYHNLKDLMSFPIKGHHYQKWPVLRPDYALYDGGSILDGLLCRIEQNDLLLSTPYQDYSAVLRFFNEAAIRPEVSEIAVTLYRIASDSLIAHALMTAAQNGKQVTVFVELKARFDEANNIKWARKLKAAGVRIVYSIWALKVHAKVALVKRRVPGAALKYCGVVATGNFNENTAGVYADHILMTSDKQITADIETLMLFLEKRATPEGYQFFKPQRLLIAGFNLKAAFLSEIGRCKQAALKGLPAAITIKLNNLEEQSLIDALYEASGAGVKIRMMVRSICRLIPGKPGLSENIEVYRLVDRYLEHSRVFIFEAAGEQSLYIGSADWMNRNIYRRIEVCCPVLDEQLARSIKDMVELQFEDELHLVRFSAEMTNEWVISEQQRADFIDDPQTAEKKRAAQLETYQYLKNLQQAPEKER